MQHDIKAQLKQAVDKICKDDQTLGQTLGSNDQPRLTFGPSNIDQMIGGGLLHNEIHEFRCQQSRHIATSYGVLFALLSRFAMGHTQQDSYRKLLLITDPAAKPDSGTLFPQGLFHFGINSADMIQVHPNSFQELLWATGEAVRTNGLMATILHIKGNPKAFDLSASRKLMLRAQTGGAPLFILRQAAHEEASSAVTRWLVEPDLSHHNPSHTKLYDEPKGIGAMRLRLSLEKNRNGQTGQWLIAWNTRKRAFEHAVPINAHTNTRSDTNGQTKGKTLSATHLKLPIHTPANGSARAGEMGQILAFEPAHE